MDFLVGTQAGLYRIAPDGKSDVLLPRPIRHVVAADEGAVALDAAGTLWNVDEDGGVLEFDELPALHATCVLLDDNDVWLGTEEAHLALLRGGEVNRVAGFDRVDGREQWYSPGGGAPAVRSIDMDDDGTIYVNVHVGGILRSTDGGITWQQTIDIATDVHQVTTVPEYAQTVVAATAQGMAITIDSGDTWEIDTDGLHATYCRAIAVAGDHVVLAATDGPEGGRTGLYRRTLDGAIFARCRQGLPPEWWSGVIDTHCIVAWDELVVAGLPDGTVFTSNDAGDRWRQLAAALPPVTAVAIL